MISNFHSVKARRFGTGLRTGDKKLATPGPGSYRPPSDFGYLDFKPKTGYSPTGRTKPSESIIKKHGRHMSIDVG